MLLRFFSFLISFSFAALAQAERRLPANVQADLLFPRHNETLSAWKDGDPALWQDVPLGISDDVFLDKVGPSPPKQFLYYPTINMTNGTTDRFEIRWGITIKKRCFGNSSMEDGGDGWSSGIDNYSVRHIVFNTAPGGQFPDVAATLDACPEGGENTTATIRVTDISSTSYGRYQCPVFETDVQPARCAYRDVAQEIAANVSADILKRIGCDEGTWQNITAPCVPKEGGTASLAGLQRGLVSWATVSGLGLVACYHML